MEIVLNPLEGRFRGRIPSNSEPVPDQARESGSDFREFGFHPGRHDQAQIPADVVLGDAWETAPRLDHLQNRRYAAVRFFRNWIVSHFSRCITAVLTWQGREVSRIGYSTWLCLIYFDSYAI